MSFFSWETISFIFDPLFFFAVHGKLIVGRVRSYLRKTNQGDLNYRRAL